MQSFFARRIYILTQERWLASVIVLLSLIQMCRKITAFMNHLYQLTYLTTVAGIGVGIGGAIVQQFSELEKLKQIVLVWLFGSVVTDAIITVSLVWFLVHYSLKTDELLFKLKKHISASRQNRILLY